MNINKDPIKKIAIVGGGTAGWFAASTLISVFKSSGLQIELIESEEIGIIGVGEATIPPLISVLHGLNINLVDFIKATQGTFKLGIQFEDWHTKGEHFFHPFGSIGKPIDGYDFFQCWLKCRAEGDKTPLMAHSPETILASKNKFFPPFDVKNTPLERADYALHLDSGLAGKFLRDFSEKKGVVRTEGKVETVQQHPNGDIKSVTLASGQVIEADFFIDCSGFKGLLIEETLKVGYEDWSQYLPCNKAVTVQTDNVGEPAPYTVAKAREAGWTWRIPLQHRTGNGYVFCDKFISDEQAKATLLDSIQGQPLMEPRFIPFTTGMRNKTWHKNCLSLGLAQGFLEPLESTAIHLVTKSLAVFIRMFPASTHNETLVNEYNRAIRKDYEEIRDFLVLHYCTTARDDSEFWRSCQTMEIPESLQYKIDYYKVAGGLNIKAEELFQSTSWHAVFHGMHVEPSRYNPTLDTWQAEKLKSILAQGAQGLANICDKQPSHKQFIQQYCSAPKL
ncbi:tryptophan halogenase family protein [Thalassotalea marina]|uniref:Tryptophan halogenase n=1 Tax=Thalassotalea marina TaxID=1673741 RepID=A0A919BBK9_9GAMM|nr:tryptophan halogenase family protein [Thalassotalea marina]GHF77420.1 tryptophan halogenase [Thalassotalea marina]